MPKKIAIIQGHPDPAARHFGHGLADAYARGAAVEGHEVKRIEVAHLAFPLLTSQTDWNSGQPPVGLREAQATLAWADHLVLVFPLWLGTMPALLKAFLEQVLRPNFAMVSEERHFPRKGLSGKSARVIVTMGMPAFWYRWHFQAHGVRGLERSILGFCGVKPVRETLIGKVETKDSGAREKWLAKVEAYGRAAN